MKFYAVTYPMDTAPDGYASHFFSSKKEADSFRSEAIKEGLDEAKENGW